MTTAHDSNDIRIFYKQCISLALAGYEVFLVAMGESYVLNGVNVVGLQYSGSGRLYRMTRGSKAIYRKALETEADVYQIHDPELLPYALKLKAKGKRVIFDSHEYYYKQILEKKYMPLILRYLVAYIYFLYETYACKRIDAVITPCSVNGLSMFEKRSRLSVFVDNTPLLDELYNKYDDEQTKKSRMICYTGVLSSERGITMLIKASCRANANLTLAGAFAPVEYFEEVKSLTEYSCVNFKGFVDRDAIYEILRESSVGICTIHNVGQYNQSDNLPTKVYEYMSMGLPVVLSNGVFARYVNRKYNCFILVDPDNLEEIASAISFLLDNPRIAKEMGMNGRLAIKNMYNWGNEEKKLLKLYEYVCSKKSKKE